MNCSDIQKFQTDDDFDRLAIEYMLLKYGVENIDDAPLSDEEKTSELRYIRMDLFLGAWRKSLKMPEMYMFIKEDILSRMNLHERSEMLEEVDQTFKDFFRYRNQ